MLETLDSILVGYTSAITIVHLETQNNYKLKVKSSRIKQVSIYNNWKGQIYFPFKRLVL